MNGESNQAAPWPLDALEGAKMILGAYHALAIAGQRIRIMDTAEAAVIEALRRSRENCKAGPMGQFFEQTQGKKTLKDAEGETLEGKR